MALDQLNGLQRFGLALQGPQGQQVLAQYQKDQQEEERRNQLAQLAADPQYANNPSALLQQVAMQTGDPSALMKLAELATPKYKTQEVNGQLIRYNENDPNNKPEVVFNGAPKSDPLSPLAKLRADFDAGRIDRGIYDKAIAKETAPAEKNYKQFALQNASFADRMVNAEGILVPFEENGTDVVNTTSNALANIPSFGLGEYLGNINLSEDQQQYKNAASEWVRAKLRKESGAAIGEREMDQEYRTYFPVSGDKPEVIKQKSALRKIATEGMIKQSQGAYEDNYGNETTSSKAISELSTEELLKRLKKK